MLRKQLLLLGKQKIFMPGVIFASRTHILRPKHMFPSLAMPGNITRNIVSATMFPSLARPLGIEVIKIYLQGSAKVFSLNHETTTK